MRIKSFPVSPFQANCYLVAADGPACVIVDPGITASEQAITECTMAGFEPEAILLTHGHLDHGGDAHVLAKHYDIPVFCHEADQPMLEEPALGLGEAFRGALGQWGITTLPLPADLRGYDETFNLAGMSISIHHAPGHSVGSILLSVTDEFDTAMFTGDVVFRGAIGRTDLPGGSMATMRQTLATMRRELPADLAIYPGHGPDSVWEEELRSNPYLTYTFLEG